MLNNHELALDISKNIALDISGADFEDENFFQKFQKMVAAHVLDLIRNDYPGLLNTLYRVDVDESIAQKCMEGDDIQTIAANLTEAIINRLIQKMEYRRQNQKKSPDEQIDGPAV